MWAAKIGGLLVIALVLYRVRCRNPLLYGGFETAVGLGVLYVAFNPAYALLAIDGPPTSLASSLLGAAAPLIGGVYIIVRGIDNIDKGLPARFRSNWDRLFHGRPLVTPNT